jgi:hypothetical protein
MDGRSVPKISTVPLIRQLAACVTATEVNGTSAHLPKGTVRGVIISVDDPKDRGRVQVQFDNMCPWIPQVTGAGEWSQERIGEPETSHWIDVCPAFKGKQPKGMVGKRVSIAVSNGEYQYAVLSDVLYDPQILTDKDGKKLEMPNNSSMTRMPIYEAGKLPPPCKENHGCTVIEKGGPYGDDWLCVCMLRSGEYLWVRQCDLQHAHAGSNDTTSYTDSGGDKPNPGKAVTSWDKVFCTTYNEMSKYSAYGTEARGNPYGDKCQWFPPPMSDKKPRPNVPPAFDNQDEALAFIRKENGFTPDIPSQPSPIPGINIPGLNAILPFLGFNIDFNKMLNSLLDYVKKRALAELSKLTGGASDTVIQATGTQI